MSDNPYRNLPSVNDVLECDSLRPLSAGHAHERIVAAVRAELDEVRRQLGRGESVDGQADARSVADQVAARLTREAQPKLRTVINATGIVLHTNLGRAPLAEEAARAAYDAARSYLNLELDLETGRDRRACRDSARRVVHLPGQEHLRALRHHRQRHAARAGMAFALTRSVG